MSLTDTLLRLAEQRVFRPIWSEPILDEVARTLAELGYPQSNVERRLRVMQEEFPEALALVPGRESPFGLPDPNDEHVLEAAVRSDAQAIVTLNILDFPVTICSAFDIDVLSPDDFLMNLFDLRPQVVCRSLIQQARDLRNPPVPISDLLGAIRIFAPTFADLVEVEIRRQL